MGKKLLRDFILLLLSGTLCFLWVLRGYKIGTADEISMKKKFYQGKVTQAYVPETTKYLVIELSEGTRDTLPFFDLRYIVETGDSIKKEIDSHKYVVYKSGHYKDSVVYTGTKTNPIDKLFQ